MVKTKILPKNLQIKENKKEDFSKLAASPDEINNWLQWAGRNLLSLPIKNPAPAGLKAHWPDFPNEWLGYNSRDVKLRPTPPAQHEIAYIDEILQLIHLVSDVNTRRILQSRAVIAPINGNFIFSWEKISRLLTIPARRIKNLHKKGLISIAQQISPEQAQKLRKFYQRTLIN